MILALPRSTTSHYPDFFDYAREQFMRNGVALHAEFAFVQYDSQDMGGNFEVQPGVNSHGNSFGTIIMAEGSSGAMDSNIIDFLEAQDIQDVVADIDLSWMALGHIDEVVSFPTTADGRARVASPEAAWALLKIAQDAGEGADTILEEMGNGSTTVDAILSYLGIYNDNFEKSDNYSEELQGVMGQLGLTSAITQAPTSGGGAPADVLSRAGYLDVYDTLLTYGDEIEWKLEFTTDKDYEFYYRKVGTTTWTGDGAGSREKDSVSTSKVVYILKAWWKSSQTTASGHTVTFRTKPSPDMIEMPVLFIDESGAVAHTNNVVNSIVDGNTLFVAHVHGPTVGGDNLFNDYVQAAATRVGFTTVTPCEERVYHNGTGSIHCGTNVLRAIPTVEADKWWNKI